MASDNNTSIPIVVQVIITLSVFTVFSFALEQACSLSIKHELFRIRIGVLLSNAILCVLSVVINFDLLREENYINFLESDFVLIVRTLQIFWLFIAFLIGYVFVTNSINSAYKSSSYISSPASSESLSSTNTNLIKQKAPSWMSTFWAICTVIEEIVLFIFYIIAFTTEDVLYLHFCFVSAFSAAVIGAVLVIFALIDILKYVYNKTQSRNRNNHARSLKKLNRLLVTMIILCTLVIALSSWNLYLLIQHIVRLINDKNHFREGSLLSRALDNVPDYVSYFVILICIEIVFIFWTYKPNKVNYCLFCCCGYKKYSSQAPFHLDRNTLCYAFCKYCIDNAEHKRMQLIESEKNRKDNKEKAKERNRYFSVTNTNAQAQNRHKRTCTNEITTAAAADADVSSDIAIVSVSNESKIKIILYDFDGVFTNRTHRYFEHWTEKQVAALTKEHLNVIFGSDQRIDNLLKHFAFLIMNDVEIYCITKETYSKINAIFNKLQFNQYFDNSTIITLQTQQNESEIKLFILNLTKTQQIDNNQLLYISSNDENVSHFADINLCVTFGVNRDHGINGNDCNKIQNLTMTTNWLDLMGDDSNLSMASIASFASLDGNNSKSKSKFDPEFDNSQQGINLLFKRNVKFLSNDDSQQSQPRKRRFKEMDCLNEKSADFDDHLPPKAKQRTNAKGEWKKRKNDEDDENKNEIATNFSRFLTPAPVAVLSVNRNRTNTNKVNKANKANTIENIEETKDAEEETTDNDKKKRRITPTLQNIVFNTDLIKLNKVPILKKKEKEKETEKGPMFLNLDQFKKLQSEKEKEKEETKEILSVWDENKEESGDDEKSEEQLDRSWATALFPQQIKRNRQIKEKEEEILVEKRAQERIHEMRMENILPPTSSYALSFKTSRESSLSVMSSSPSSSSLASTATIANIIIPSNDATQWREKQIKIGKETDGYQNYIKKYPNKDLRFRLNNNLMTTPEPKEKIGKKRWVGKYNKWRKFLHKFDVVE